MAIPRMRTLPETVAELKRLDSETAITLTALRRMVNTGELPYTAIQSKRLINFDLLLDKLSNPTATPCSSNYGQIRQIN